MKTPESIKVEVLDFCMKNNFVSKSAILVGEWAYKSGQQDVGLVDCLNKLKHKFKSEIGYQTNPQNFNPDGFKLAEAREMIGYLEKIKL